MASGMVAMARSVGEAFSEDPKTKVGCVIVCPRSSALLGIGWNSLPDGVCMSPNI
jgi:deoxycytidylate deaminase